MDQTADIACIVKVVRQAYHFCEDPLQVSNAIRLFQALPFSNQFLEALHILAAGGMASKMIEEINDKPILPP